MNNIPAICAKQDFQLNNPEQNQKMLSRFWIGWEGNSEEF